MRLALGNVFVDDLAAPGVPLNVLTPGSGTSTGIVAEVPASVTRMSSGVSGATPATSPPPTGRARSRPELVAVITRKPGWLLALYLLWQVVLLVTLASLWWWRKASVPS